ncbi:transmembrane emp24 domain-containing protein 5 isoform X1 [Anopheles bellator]|uniref:transmembrane emp24 domain-containing protein 5 isoform X1 n=1 Tax=Anopheles bellator TaxID=139047 RepID=UPI002648B8B6|nr:transmembrane emp24 domain-containing protein 5 isoform X1 [Anopheles bellator]
MVVWKGFTWHRTIFSGIMLRWAYILLLCPLVVLVGTQQPQQMSQQHQQQAPQQQQQQPPPPPPPHQQHPAPAQQQFQQHPPPQQEQFQQHPPPQQQLFQQHPPPVQQQFQQRPSPQQQQQHQAQPQFQNQPEMMGQHHPPPPMVAHHQPLELSDSDRAWYDTLPAVAMDYKVHIEAGKEDCYFQYVRQGSTLYVSFHVIRGGDGMAGFAVRNPRGEIVHPYQWQASSDYTDGAAMGGFYAVCIDNQFSRFASKLVNLYITVIRYEEWEKFTKEIEDLNVNMNNFTNTISTVERNMNAMFQYQTHSRNNEARDYALIVDNNAYVWKWSVLQILVIVFTTSVQVYFVRKLFDIKTGTSGKSRI